MSTTFIPLNCQNCGGKLEIYPDMDRFACGYCGTEMMVQRRGGTVALKAVTEAIAKIQVGTDKTAAELALVRLETEMRQLMAKALMTRETESGVGKVIGRAIVLMVLGVIWIAKAGLDSLGSLLLLASLLFAASRWAKWSTSTEELAGLESQIQALQGKIEEKKQIVDA